MSSRRIKKQANEEYEGWYRPGHVRFSILADLRLLDTDEQVYGAIREIELDMRGIQRKLADKLGIKSEIRRGGDAS
jgi:hypothetical protein